jgi:hypothetical protein
LGTDGFVEEARIEERDAVLAPGDVGELVDELGFGGGGGAVLVEELLDVAVEGGQVLGGQYGSLGCQAMLDRIERRALFAGFGARAGGTARVRTIDSGALSLSNCG